MDTPTAVGTEVMVIQLVIFVTVDTIALEVAMESVSWMAPGHQALQCVWEVSLASICMHHYDRVH